MARWSTRDLCYVYPHFSARQIATNRRTVDLPRLFISTSLLAGSFVLHLPIASSVNTSIPPSLHCEDGSDDLHDFHRYHNRTSDHRYAQPLEFAS